MLSSPSKAVQKTITAPSSLISRDSIFALASKIFVKKSKKETERELNIIKAKDKNPEFLEFCEQTKEEEVETESEDESVENEFWNEFHGENKVKRNMTGIDVRSLLGKVFSKSISNKIKKKQTKSNDNTREEERIQNLRSAYKTMLKNQETDIMEKAK